MSVAFCLIRRAAMSPTPENLQMANYAFDEGARIANLVRHEYLKQVKNNNNPEKNSEQKFGGFQALIRRESTMNKKPKRIRENEEGKSWTHAALFVFKSFYCFGSMCLNPFLDSKENNWAKSAAVFPLYL